ncbi:MAG TPA: molybdenum cofactor biosynthesis protein MoaE [Anaeromyxobacteraceae bacterium]|nr:molybdenum cofactor biosynthesis protein MoaE [Anaeromyxobacteraceae bacterium]
MAVHVLYFALTREVAGGSTERLEPPPRTVGELRARLLALHPGLSGILPRCRVAVDQEFADDATALADGAEVALIPPVSGGAGRCRVTDAPLSLADVVAPVEDPGRGGVVTFTGVVRGETGGRRVLRLEYEGYREMAERKLDEIAGAIERETGALVAIAHRLGALLPGEAAVVIACAAAHRAPAFRACEAAIERLKHDVPIWKREVYEDGSEWVGSGP